MYSNLNDNCDASVRSRQEMLSYCEENHLSAPSWLAFKSTTAFYKHTNRTWIVFARIYTVCCLLAAYTLAAWTLLVFSYSRLCIVQHTHTACDSLCLVCSVYKWRDVSKNRTLPSKTTIQTKNNQRNNSSEKGRKNATHNLYVSFRQLLFRHHTLTQHHTLSSHSLSLFSGTDCGHTTPRFCIFGNGLYIMPACISAGFLCRFVNCVCVDGCCRYFLHVHLLHKSLCIGAALFFGFVFVCFLRFQPAVSLVLFVSI